MINMSASPFVIDKHDFRLELFTRQCRRHKLPLIYVNQVGGNDELVFDGASCVIDQTGKLLAQGEGFQEDLLIVDILREMDRNAEEMGTQSIVPYYLSLMDAERAASVQRKMTKVVEFEEL